MLMREFSQLGLFLLCLFIPHGHSKSHIDIGYRVLLQVPTDYTSGFTGRAFLMETASSHTQNVNFNAALSVEGRGGRYSCALEAFLGNERVWNSGHFSQFFVTDQCVIELTQDGDLRLKGPGDQIGWRTGTSGQGVQGLRLLKNGNLVLMDARSRIKWQSFTFPTNVLLLGQKIDVTTRLTAFPDSTNSTSFYSLEVQIEQIALYLNVGSMKYSYWDFKPSDGINISFVEMGAKGLEVFDENYTRIGRIASVPSLEPVLFLALGNETGNLGLYFYSSEQKKFEASFQALNTTCELPMACKPYTICNFFDECSCIRLAPMPNPTSNCSQGLPGSICDDVVGSSKVDMLELRGVTSVLKGSGTRSSTGVSKEACSAICLDDCKCVGALYSFGGGMQECFLYGLVSGVRQVQEGTGFSYFLKVPKGSAIYHEEGSGVKKWILMLVGAADGLIIFLVMVGVLYYVIWRRKRDSSNDEYS